MFWRFGKGKTTGRKFFMPYKLAQLAVNPEHKSEILSRIFVSQPSMEEEQILGKLFVLVEIKNNKTDIMLANFIIDRMNLFYYQNEQVPLLSRLATVTVSDIFEHSLNKLNQDIVNFTQTEKIPFNPHNFNITIGIIFKNKLYFSNLGHNKAILIYKSKIKNNRQINDYNLINITASTADPTQEIVLDNKLFTNTVAGSVPPAGYMIFTNESLHEFLSEKQLIKIITTLPPAGAAQQIKNILEQTNIYMPFIGLIIQNQQFTKPLADWQAAIVDPRVKLEPSPIHHALEPNRRREQEFRQERDLNKESIKALNRTAAKTAQILRPPGFVNWDKIKKILASIKLPNTKAQANKLIINRANLSWLKRESVMSVKKLFDGLRTLTALITNLTNSVWQIISNRQQQKQLQEQATVFKNRLNKKHLIILATAGLCLIILGINLYFGNVRKARRVQEAAWQSAQEQFSQKEKQITADLLYDNKNKAEISLEEMTPLLEQLKNNAGDKHGEELKVIEQNYQALVDKISGLTRLNAPEKIWSLPDGQAGDGLALSNNKLYTIANNGHNAWEFSLDSQTSQTIIEQTTTNLQILNNDREGNTFFLTDNEIITLNKNGQTSRKPLKASAPPAMAAVYNNRFYVFSNQDKQIYRHQLTSTPGTPEAWLRDSVATDIKDLAIDTSIYLLTANNILEYYASLQQPLILDNVFPKIEQAKKLAAPAATDILALIDPPTKRLIIFSRSGKLLNQYVSDVWNNLQGVAFDANGKTAYLLNGGDVYKVNLK